MNNKISSKAKDALNNRLKTSENFSELEISNVSAYDFRLFSEGQELDQESSLLLRNLCASSYVSKTLNIKKSHRPVIGPIIFYAKRALVKILNPLLKTQLDQIENFNHSAVKTIAKLYNNSKK